MPQKKERAPAKKPETLPEYLEHQEVNALIQVAHSEIARLLMLIQWRAGLRISEALSLTPADLDFHGERPTLRVRSGKGQKTRLVPLHAELALALRNALAFGNVKGPIFTIARTTAWRWIQTAMDKAVSLNQIPPGKNIGTHTLRHSAARHWLASGVPINVVQLWLGHASLSTTLIYLKLLPDPQGYMDRVE